MKVKEIMTKNIAFVNLTSKVIEAAQLMQKHNIGVIPVCDQNGVVGIVTDRDIVVRNVAHGTNPQTLSVGDVMTSQVKTVSPEMDIDDVSKIMAAEQIRRIPVVENQKIVGMVSLGDFATSDSYTMEAASDLLADISKPSKPKNMAKK